MLRIRECGLGALTLMPHQEVNAQMPTKSSKNCARTMTQSVVIDVVYPDFAKLRSEGKHKEYPVLCKFKTFRFIDQVTGEPSLYKFNGLVQEALCALLLGGGDSTDIMAEAETEAKQLVLRAKSSVREDDKCAEHKEDDNIAELPTEKGLDAVAGDETPTSSSSKSLPSSIAFSLQEKEDPHVYKFALQIICDGGLPSFDKFIHLVAGIYKVHPARVSLILDSPIETEINTSVQGDRKLREALETSTVEVLSFRVAFTKPKLINLSINGEDRSFQATGVSYETLCSIVTSQREPAVGASWKYKDKVPIEIVTADKAQHITSNEVLMDILHSIPCEQVDLVASFAPAAVLLPNELATFSCLAKLGTGQDPRPIQIRSGNDVASWALGGMIPGIYKATFSVSYGYSNCSAHIHVGTTAKAGSLSVTQLQGALPKLTFPGTNTWDSYVESTTGPFEVSGLPNATLVAVVYHQVNIRSVVLDYVGPLPKKS